ncbi:hypothetical protein BC332_27910 [Capsicum chinense]|nr:hypothetical protein BC332_27910 [Capsicum chinense]
MKAKNPRPKSSKLLTFFNPILSFFKPNHRETRFMDLPRVIMVEILSKLPIAFILSSRRICKLWYDLFSDPLFLTMYRSRLPPPCILFSRDHGISQLLELDLCCDDYSSRIRNRPILLSRPGLNTPVKRSKDILVEDYPMLRLIGSSPPLVAVVNNQFMLLTMLKCRLGSMKSITKNGFIELNSWYLVKDLKNGTCSAKSNQRTIDYLQQLLLAGDTEDVAGMSFLRLSGTGDMSEISVHVSVARSYSSAHVNSFESAPPMPPIT